MTAEEKQQLTAQAAAEVAKIVREHITTAMHGEMRLVDRLGVSLTFDTWRQCFVIKANKSPQLQEYLRTLHAAGIDVEAVLRAGFEAGKKGKVQ